MSEVKTMQDEMNEEWMELAVSNIHKLIPEDWMPRINEILPKILNVVKMGIKKNIKHTAEQLGNTKMFIVMNMPTKLANSNDIVMVPSYFKIDKKQLGPSQYNESTGEYELQLKPGEQPEIMFSMMTLAEKISAYDDIQLLIKDVKDGNFITMEDMTGQKNTDQKQIG